MMRLPKFEYRTPQTIAEAVKIIGDVGPEAQFVAGGTDLYPNMKRRQQMPQTVISVMRLLQLLRPKLRMAEGNQLLPEERRRCVLGGAWQLKMLGRPVIRSRARHGRDWREVSAGFHLG